MGYFRKHWRGELSLSISFWVNFCLVNIILNAVATVNSKGVFSDNPVIVGRISTIYIITFLMLVTPWQIIGLWRAGTNHVRQNRRYFWSVIVKTILILALLIRLGQTVYYWPMHRDTFKIAFLKDNMPDYTMELLDDNAILHFEGGFPFGTSKEVEKVLDANPDIEKVILDSMGGRIYEARRIANLILERQLDTCTVQGCFSAATLPFAAGKNRFLCEGAALGFHRYSIPESSWDYDFQKEYQKDWAFYQSRGVTKDFQEKMFTADPNDFWTPSDLELYNGGMIHAVLGLTDVLPMEDAIVFGYDTSRKSSEIASDDITDEQMKRWILGCSSVLWERNRDGFDTLAGKELNKLNIESQKASISEWWGIEDRESLLKCLYGLTQRGGHNDDFIRDGRRVYKMTDEELEAFLEQYKSRPQKCNEYRIAHQYYQALGEKGILAWETTRYMCLCRWGYLCGWLDEQTAWELMIPIARHLQQQFGSWEEMGQNYLIGRHYWSLKHFKDGKELYDEALCRLLEMPSSPWNKYPWNLDLSGAYEVVPAPVPLQEMAEGPTPVAIDPTDGPEPLMPAIDMPVLPELVFSKVNTLSDLQKNSPVLVVPDEYETIQAAIDAAKEGDTIFIKEGVYSGHVSMKKKNGIRMVGQNTSKVILRTTDPNNYSVLHVEDCRDVVISDLTVSETMKNLGDRNSSVTVQHSDFKILNCRISNTRGSGIAYYSASKGVIKNTLVELCHSDGISLSETGTDVTLSDCCIRDNKKSGFNGYKGANVVIHNTLLERNESGLLISQQGTEATLTHCVIRENAKDGLTVWNQGRVRVTDTVLESNNRTGIYVLDERTHVDCVHSYVLNNALGIFVEKKASADISKSVCYENRKWGFFVGSGARGTIENNDIRKNTLSGIAVGGKGTHVLLKNNQCIENGKAGIRVYDGASAEVKDSICQNNKQIGIEVFEKGSQAEVNGNTCSGNHKSGIRISDGASAKLTDNICQNNKQNGIDVYRNGASAILKNNHCLWNGHHGILFSDSAIGVAENCLCEENIRSGIFVLNKGTQADLINNQCSANKYNGIVISDGAGPDVNLTGNTCLGNYPSGILIDEGATGQVSHNTCRYNPWAGIAIKGDQTNPSVTENTFDNNGTWGILLWAGADPNLSSNTTQNNGIDGLMKRE
ncbi:MAG: right-handed parallel beta-helix repeat-containing protein [Planctomycetes bacterium]|nr:right-handed parallel beta-helix repeat-containing protein [Planctomycetota bacterium]